MGVRTTYYRTIMYDQKMYLGTGLVGRWMRKITLETEVAVKAKAPPNRSHAKEKYKPRHGTGQLLASIYSANSSTPSLRIARGEVGAGPVSDELTEDYVPFVLGGTAGQGTQYIYSHEGWVRKAEVDYMFSGTRRAAQMKKESGDQGLYMKVRAGSRYKAGPRLRVHGQRANNFLQDGYNEIARSHRALKPMRRRFVWRE